MRGIQENGWIRICFRFLHARAGCNECVVGRTLARVSWRHAKFQQRLLLRLHAILSGMACKRSKGHLKVPYSPTCSVHVLYTHTHRENITSKCSIHVLNRFCVDARQIRPVQLKWLNRYRILLRQAHIAYGLPATAMRSGLG